MTLAMQSASKSFTFTFTSVHVHMTASKSFDSSFVVYLRRSNVAKMCVAYLYKHAYNHGFSIPHDRIHDVIHDIMVGPCAMSHVPFM